MGTTRTYLKKRKPPDCGKTPIIPCSETWVRRGIAIVGIALVAGCLYSPVIHHPFIGFDDPDYVTQNVHVKRGLTPSTFIWAWTSLEHGNWHPITWLSHAADVQVFGLDAAGHHFSALVFHAADAALLFLVLTVLTRSFGCSLAVALFFAVHPVNVESVAWVAERKSLLSAFWSLLALLAYIRYVRSENPKWLAATTGFFFIALASKPMAITLPLLLVLLDRWPLERVSTWQKLLTKPKLWTEKTAMFALCGASAMVTIIAQHRSGAMASITQVPLASRFENAIVSYGFYAWKLIWPSNLALLYPWPQHGVPLAETAGALLFLLTATLLAWSQREGRPWLMVGWLWFLGTLVPVIGLVQVGSQSRADRYAYIPMIGLLVATVWSGAEVTRVFQAARLWLAGVIVVAIALFLAAATRMQINVWSSEDQLWLNAWQVTTDNYIAADKVGAGLQKQGRYQDALPYFKEALQINPADPLANFDIGAGLHLQGKLPEAIHHYQLTASQDTSPALRADAFENMGAAYTQLGNLQLARECYLMALQYDPGRMRVFAALREVETRAQTSIAR